MRRGFFTSDHLRILLAVSSKMALAIENAPQVSAAENSATTDYLTGLADGARCSCNLTRAGALQRDNTTLTVMVSDMDGFKQINDRLAILEGNRVLRLFCPFPEETSREYDYVARMGGDELW